jgi:hypothetical protein
LGEVDLQESDSLTALKAILSKVSALLNPLQLTPEESIRLVEQLYGSVLETDLRLAGEADDTRKSSILAYIQNTSVTRESGKIVVQYQSKKEEPAAETPPMGSAPETAEQKPAAAPAREPAAATPTDVPVERQAAPAPDQQAAAAAPEPAAPPKERAAATSVKPRAAASARSGASRTSARTAAAPAVEPTASEPPAEKPAETPAAGE